MLSAKALKSRRSRRSGSVAVLLSLCALLTPFRGNAIETVTDIGIFCTSSGQLCEPPFSLEVETGEMLQVNYVIPASHCSSVKLYIFVDSVLQVTTDFLGWIGAPPPFDALPLETGLLELGPVAAGRHLLIVQAEGQESGCNPGTGLADWGGTLHVFTTPLVGVGGSLTGMSVTKGKVICRNVTTKQTVKMSIPEGARSWNCEQTGLVVNPGDIIKQTIMGTGPAD